MKVKVPKLYHQLHKAQQEKIKEMITEEVIDQVVREEAELQKIWLQLACIVLNRSFGFGRKRLLLFLANWREMYRINSKLGSKEEQTKYLTAEMDRIFRKEGYPYEYVNKLEEV